VVSGAVRLEGAVAAAAPGTTPTTASFAALAVDAIEPVRRWNMVGSVDIDAPILIY